MKHLIKKAVVAAAAVTPVMAMAHDGHESTNLLAGLVHFISSPDHLLTIVVVAAAAGYVMRKISQSDSE